MKPLIILALALLPACAALNPPAPQPCARVTILIEGTIVEDEKDEAVDDPIYFPLLGHPDLKR